MVENYKLRSLVAEQEALDKFLQKKKLAQKSNEKHVRSVAARLVVPTLAPSKNLTQKSNEKHVRSAAARLVVPTLAEK